MTEINGEQRERLSIAEASDLGAVLSSLVQSGYPLEAGLDAAARELPRGKLARSLTAVSRQMRQGRGLDEAIAAQGQKLPEHVRALVAAGLRTLRLGQVLEEFVAIQRRTAEIRRTVYVSLAYPTVLLVLVVAVFTLFGVAVVPVLTQVVDDFDMELPRQTQLLIGMSHSGLWVLAANLTVVICGWLLAWLSSEVAEIRSMMHAIPLLGPISRWASLAQFSRLMALLLESELPLPAALKLAGRGSQDADLAVACLAASRRVDGGQALCQALAGLPQFPKSLGPIVAWGQQAGALPDALRTAAEMFEGRLQAQLVLLRTVVPPFAFLAVLWVVLFLISSFVLPLITLIEKLS
jgi:type II secretory pathway component PulF